MDAKELVEEAMCKRDPLPSLIEMLLSKNKEMRKEAAFGLMELEDPRAIKYLIKQGSLSENRAICAYALSSFDCSGYEMDLITMGLNGAWEVKHHIINAISNIECMSFKTNKMLITSVELSQALIKSEKVVNLPNIDFLNEILRDLMEMPLKEPAQIIQFPVKNIKPKKVSKNLKKDIKT